MCKNTHFKAPLMFCMLHRQQGELQQIKMKTVEFKTKRSSAEEPDTTEDFIGADVTSIITHFPSARDRS